MGNRTLIDNFLAQRRFAMVGVSRKEKDFSRSLFRAFCDQGYDVVPVNPQAGEIEGKKCCAKVGETSGISAALLMTPPNLTDAVVRECADSGIETVWVFRTVGHETQTFCASRNIGLIAGQCPFMFLQRKKFPHNLHAGILRLFGKYPS